MSGNYILDTNIIIALFAGDQDVLEEIAIAGEIFIPSIVVGELLYGAHNSGKPDQNIKKIEKFCNDIQILNCDISTAQVYGLVKKQLKDIGKPIPENDIWISALSKQHQIPLVSRDKHFDNIPELDLRKW
nr:type II toxin-antitoxin system VapC family toxin [Bacteroidota bacterium]